ncbi:hypothetical protein [Moheibacter sediminis]|uniref:Uncharacterized protein n=1 Tax=Moheibacter sediminis TaxID=1434700 RepID=A0A1W2BVI9_9FLAO|nr:hypothetical protein [Moheibacter sediminis]SMC76622.1 hypothetical protein SAMN06296427_107157 [Moheibacter sediminis]
MKLFFSFFLLSVIISAQTDTLQIKLDSIIREADLMYQYEKIAWKSSDLAMEDKDKLVDFGGYFIYHSADTLKAVYYDVKLEKALSRYYFDTKDLNKPLQIFKNVTDLTDKERDLASVKQKVLVELNQNPDKYELSFQEGYNPNVVMLPFENKFHFYIIIGTNKGNIIPFGNDYFFEADLNGEIKNWKRFHKTLIQTSVSEQNGSIPISFIHTHLPMTPYISATDICTFRLYGVDLFDKKSFIVSSTALKMNFIYDAETNKIITTNLIK